MTSRARKVANLIFTLTKAHFYCTSKMFVKKRIYKEDVVQYKWFSYLTEAKENEMHLEMHQLQTNMDPATQATL